MSKGVVKSASFAFGTPFPFHSHGLTPSQPFTFSTSKATKQGHPLYFIQETVRNKAQEDLGANLSRESKGHRNVITYRKVGGMYFGNTPILSEKNEEAES